MYDSAATIISQFEIICENDNPSFATNRDTGCRLATRLLKETLKRAFRVSCYQQMTGHVQFTWIFAEGTPNARNLVHSDTGELDDGTGDGGITEDDGGDIDSDEEPILSIEPQSVSVDVGEEAISVTFHQ